MFACTPCLIVYRDGVDYHACVRCETQVDWVDERFPALACRRCDVFVNGSANTERCPHCAQDLVVLATAARVRPPPRSLPSLTSAPTMARYALIAFLVVQTVLALIDPDGYPYLAPMLVVLQIGGLAIVALIVLMSRDVRSVFDHRTRILHGLEHATIAILLERRMPVLSGVTHRGQFLIVIDNNGRTWEREAEIGDAAREAIRRVMAGEHALAYTIHCGTSYLVAIALFAFAVVGAGLGAGLLGAPVGIMWAVTVGAALVARTIARRTGLAVQRWLTVSTDLAHGTVINVERSVTSDGDRIHAVVSIDVTPRAREGGLVAL